MKEQRIKVTLRVEERVHKAAERLAARSGAPVASVLADAAKQALLPEYQEAREEKLHKAAERTLGRLRRLEARFTFELHVLKEMVGLLARTYLNHTPAIPESERDAASMSGRARFERFLDLLARNVRPGKSILGSSLPALPAEPEERPPEPVKPMSINSPTPKENKHEPPSAFLFSTDPAAPGVSASDRATPPS